LPDTRPVSEALASLASIYTIVHQLDALSGPPDDETETNVEELAFGGAYWIWIDGTEAVTPYLAPPRRTPEGIIPGN